MTAKTATKQFQYEIQAYQEDCIYKIGNHYYINNSEKKAFLYGSYISAGK